MYQWFCRKCFGCMALLVCAVSAYNYQDLNTINNQQLLKILKQFQKICDDLQQHRNTNGLLGMFFFYYLYVLVLSAYMY